jgi:hypothetical protein
MRRGEDREQRREKGIMFADYLFISKKSMGKHNNKKNRQNKITIHNKIIFSFLHHIPVAPGSY